MGEKSNRAQREKSSTKKVLKTIKKYNMLEKEETVVCAVSGGPDSMVMLDILCQLNESNDIDCNLVVAHINHKIRNESEEEAKYVEEFCKNKKIQFFKKEIAIEEYAKEFKIGTEEAGRKVRYKFFDEVAKEVSATKIAIAHNKNDKAETILLNIFRGTGINGLKGIEEKREKYIRPILDLKRDEIESYAKEYELNPRIDQSNFLDIYSRNKIRNNTIPYVEKEFNPNIIETLDRLSKIVAEQQEYILEQTANAYEELIIKEAEKEYAYLDLKKFNQLPKILKSNVILRSISIVKGDILEIERVNIEDTIEMCAKNVGNKYLIPTKEILIGVKNQKIEVRRQ